MKSKVIIGSGLVALICRKILGSDWQILPLAPSRFYSRGVPALGDDFVTYDQSVLEIIKNWGLNTSPLFYKRPYSISGSLLYNDSFADRYFDRIGIDANPQTIDYYKNTFTVFQFSCLQLWSALLREFINEIKMFQEEHPNVKTINRIADHTITLSSGEILEYKEAISTVPYYALCKWTGMLFNGRMDHTYQYFIKDDNIDLEGANQALICDEEIPFHKCTKISHNKYLLEVIGHYYDNFQDELGKIIGYEFEILSGAIIENGHVFPHKIDIGYLNDQHITCIGSYAQCDPLIDIGSVIKRTHNLLKKNKIQQ